MNLPGSARKLALAGLNFVARHGHDASRDARNVDLCLAARCTAESMAEVRFPVDYLEFIRTCIEQARCSISEIKRDSSKDVHGQRFTTILDVLSSRIPTVEFSAAAAIALVADRYRTRRQELPLGDGPSDLGMHFELASSFGRKGRVLTTLVRFSQASRILELGTAYGMSALFILEALRDRRESHLTTIEGWESLYSLSSPLLTQLYGDMVSCRLGKTGDVLPELVQAAASFDLMFHDAGHAGQDYIDDFNAIRAGLNPGAIVLIDDIRYAADSHQGWTAVCADSRVRRAAELDGNLGMLLLN